MTAVKSICVYCGSSTGADGAHLAAAGRFGQRLAAEGITLVFGGANIGLMKVVADAALDGGGRVVGVIPESLKGVELAHGGVSELVVVDSMHQRKQRMFELADAFVILPGGLGTLDETFEIITWKQLGLHDKPVVLVDSEGYWGPLGALVDHVIGEGFARPEVASLFTVVKSADEVLAAIAAAPEPAIAPEPDRL